VIEVKTPLEILRPFCPSHPTKNVGRSLLLLPAVSVLALQQSFSSMPLISPVWPLSSPLQFVRMAQESLETTQI
jgi:hypothetical protein